MAQSQAQWLVNFNLNILCSTSSSGCDLKTPFPYTDTCNTAYTLSNQRSEGNPFGILKWQPLEAGFLLALVQKVEEEMNQVDHYWTEYQEMEKRKATWKWGVNKQFELVLAERFLRKAGVQEEDAPAAIADDISVPVRSCELVREVLLVG